MNFRPVIFGNNVSSTVRLVALNDIHSLEFYSSVPKEHIVGVVRDHVQVVVDILEIGSTANGGKRKKALIWKSGDLGPSPNSSINYMTLGRSPSD